MEMMCRIKLGPASAQPQSSGCSRRQDAESLVALTLHPPQVECQGKPRDTTPGVEKLHLSVGHSRSWLGGP